MTLSHIPIDKITESDLQSLIDNQICESKYIDYKRCIPTNTENNNSKTEFLSDVASFANAQGGELLYGIKESNGLPEEIIGCETDNPEKEILRLEGIIRSGIEKPIMGIEIRPIPLENGKYCFVIRIPNSQFKPHFVKHNSLFRVVSRNSSGKNDLGVDEIGELFLRSQNRKEAIRNFRLKRVSEILAGETPVPVDEGPKLVIHLIPTIEQNIDLKKLHHHKLIVPPNHTQGCCVNDQINLDGLVRHHKTRDSSPSYVQIYAERAMIESVFDMNYSIK